MHLTLSLEKMPIRAGGSFGLVPQIALVTCALVAFAGVANAGTLYLARMSGANEVPAVTTTFSGLGVLILNDAETQGTITATHDITLPLTGGHIHRAPAGSNGSVAFPFAAPSSPVGPLVWDISAADIVNLKAAGLYMNFHTAVNPGGAIRSQLVRALLAPAGTTAPQVRIANALDVSAGYTADLDRVLIQTNLASTAVQSQVLGDLTARTIYAAPRQEIEALSSAARSVFNYIGDVRDGSTAPTTGQFTPFLLVGSEFGRRSSTDAQAGSTVSRPFLAAGIDGRFGAGVRGGLTLGYTDAQDTFTANLGKTKAKIISFQAYGSMQLGDTGIAMDAVLGYGWGKLSSDRAIPSLARTATASPDGSVWSAALKASKTITLKNHATLIPYALVENQEAKVDGYSETGADAVGLVVPRTSTRNTAIEGGAAFVMPIKVAAGRLSARVQMGWHYLLEEGEATVSTRLVGSPVAFATAIAGPGQSALAVEASLTAVMDERTTGTLGYRGMLGAERATIHAIEARVIFRF